jgi:ABC-type cobalamin/Fe3+-siderophores transport system ATPase subunit
MASDVRAIQPRPRRRRVPPEPLFISHLSVRALFGQISYNNLSLVAPESGQGRLNVLFGDNGAGKTTILHLIYSALSPQTGVGLRGYIAQTPFESFAITFSDGSSICIDKSSGLTGTYRYRSVGFTDLIDVNIVAGEENRVAVQEGTVLIEHFLSSLRLEVLFVDHERYIRSTYRFLSDISSVVGSSGQGYLIRTPDGLITEARRGKERSIQFPLEGMVDAVNQTFRNQAFQQGATGEQNASAVYLEISRAIIKPKKRGPSPERDKKSIDETLKDLEDETSSFTRYGLLSNYPFEELRQMYGSASKAKKQSIGDILAPFVTSVSRRVNALRGLHDLLMQFEGELNKYLTNKTASVHVLHGLVIQDRNGPIPLRLLSSGEKQLVFLLCAAVVARGFRSLILIDEPELSLNYKWQRMVAGSLAKLSSPSTQFIMASHSIEIISRYANSAVELLNEAPERSEYHSVAAEKNN